MKKYRWTLPALFLAAAVAVWIFMPNQMREEAEDHLPKKIKDSPGYYEQFLTMKQNSEGIIPKGLFSLWKEADRLNKKNGDTRLVQLEEVGPYNVGGRTRALLIDRADPNHILAGGISGGLWQSQDGGATWLANNDFASNISVSCITQNLFDPDIIYYGTGEGIGNSAGIPGEGIFKSEDGGASFKQLASTLNDTFEYIWSVKSSLIDSHTIYVSTHTKGVYRSNDGGQTFSNIYSTNQQVYDLEVFPDGRVMFGVRNTGLVISPSGDSGTFVRPAGTPTSTRRVEIAYCDSFPNVVYAAYANSNGNDLQGIYRSDDTGTSWTQVSSPPSSMVSYKFAWYCFMLSVKPDDPDVLVSGSVTAGYSQDGGTTWLKLDNSHADYHSVANFPNSTESFLIGNDGGIYRYGWNNLGDTFTDLNQGYNVTQFYTGAYGPYGLTFFGGTQDNGTWVSQESNRDFDKVYGGDGSFTQVHQQQPEVVYVSWQNGNILRTDDITAPSPDFDRIKNELDQNNDGDIDQGAWFINPFEINLEDGDQVYFITRQRLHRSTNRGDNWEPVTDNISQSFPSTLVPYAIGLSKGLNPTIYVGGQQMLFYRIDEARTAQPGAEVDLRGSVPSSIRSSFISNIEVHPSDHSIIYVALSNYEEEPRIWKVTGATSSNPQWIDISGDLPSLLPVNWIEADPLFPDSVIIAATDFGLYITTNGGTSWIKEERIPNVSVHQVRLRESDRTLFIFTHGRGVWRARMDPVWPITGIVAEAKDTRPTIYPNPTSGNIWLHLPHNWEEGLLHVYDAGGKSVASFRLRKDVPADLSALQPGIYLYRVSAGNREYSGKLLKR